MSELRRLVDEESDEVLLAVLRSADDDVPREDGPSRALAAIGIPLAALGAGAAGAGAAGATGAGAGVTTTGMMTKSAVAGVALWKWVAGAVVLSAAVGGATILEPGAPSSTRDGPLAKPVATAIAATTSPRAEALAPTAEPSTPTAQPPAAPSSADITAPAGTTAVVARRSPVAATSPSAATPPRAGTGTTPPSLAVELAALDEARTAVASGAPDRAIARLDRYDRESGAHVLGEEATVLRIEALVAKGDQGAARAIAGRFLASHPGTTYQDRVTTLLQQRAP